MLTAPTPETRQRPDGRPSEGDPSALVNSGSVAEVPVAWTAVPPGRLVGGLVDTVVMVVPLG